MGGKGYDPFEIVSVRDIQADVRRLENRVTDLESRATPGHPAIGSKVRVKGIVDLPMGYTAVGGLVVEGVLQRVVTAAGGVTVTLRGEPDSRGTFGTLTVSQAVFL